jgi:hypothetical protein
LTQIPKPPVQGGFRVSELHHTDFRQGRAASNPEEVTMIRYDFDVVSDPLPPKPIAPPAAATQPGRKRREGEPMPGAPAGEDMAAGSPRKAPP